jgi:hypothetical protein
MLNENSSAFAFLLAQMADKIPQEELPSLVGNSVDAMDEFILISACLNRIAFYTDFDAVPDGGKMLATVNCAISDLGFMIADLNRCWESTESIQAAKQRQDSISNEIKTTPAQGKTTPLIGKNYPHTGVKEIIGGGQ